MFENENSSEKKIGVGVDFGTTNSIVSTYNPSTKKIVCHRNQTELLPHPSVVWYRNDGSKVIGIEAKRNMIGFSNVEGHYFISSVKRMFGKNKYYSIFGKSVSAIDVASDIFRFLKEDAGRRGDEYRFERAVVTVPIYFNGFARREVRKSADKAGIYINSFVHEPFAAIIGYYYRKGWMTELSAIQNQKILVFDWGGGTLDITITQIKEENIYELATSALNDKAGDYFNYKIADFAKAAFLERIGAKPDDIEIMTGDKDILLAICERRKIDLSTQTTVQIAVPNICKYNGKYQDMDETITRDDFNRLIKSTVKEARSKVNQALDIAGLTSQQIDLVLLIGGSSMIPYVRYNLSELFGHRIVNVENGDTIIAEGAAIIDSLNLQLILANSINVELSDRTQYVVFKQRALATSTLCYKKINFFCTDNRDGIANLVIQNHNTREILSIPHSTKN